MSTSEFEVSTDHPSYNKVLTSSRPISQSRECSAGTDIVQYPTPVKSLDDKGLTINKERDKSLDDWYCLCYTIELSDSSADEDKNWPAGSEDVNFPDTAIIATGDNLAMEGFNNNTHCGRLYKPLL